MGSAAAKSAVTADDVRGWAAGSEAVRRRLAGRSGRSGPRRRVLARLRGPPRGVGREGGWRLAGHAGGDSPHAPRRLLGRAARDADAAGPRAYVAEHPADPGGVLIASERPRATAARAGAGLRGRAGGHRPVTPGLPAPAAPAAIRRRAAGPARQKKKRARWPRPPHRKSASRCCG
jgi:hypothetical protein